MFEKAREESKYRVIFPGVPSVRARRYYHRGSNVITHAFPEYKQTMDCPAANSRPKFIAEKQDGRLNRNAIHVINRMIPAISRAVLHLTREWTT